MKEVRVKDDARLLAIVFVVWGALAVLYAFVPMFHMPGYAEVWGIGALIFLALMVALRIAASRARQAQASPRLPSADVSTRKGDRHVG
jgi:hypothetical protein